MKRLVEQSRTRFPFVVAELEFRAPDRIDVERVGGQQRPIVHEEIDHLARVARRDDRFEGPLADRKHLVSIEGRVLEVDVAFGGACAEIVRYIEAGGQIGPAGDVVGVDVGVDHARNREVGLLGGDLVLVDVGRGIDDDGLTRGVTADDVPQTPLRAALDLDDRRAVADVDRDVIVDAAPAFHAAVDGLDLVLVGRRLEPGRQVARGDAFRTDRDHALGVADGRFELLETPVEFLFGAEREVDRPRDVPGLVAVLGARIDEGELGVLVLEFGQAVGGECRDHTLTYAVAYRNGRRGRFRAVSACSGHGSSIVLQFCGQ